MLKNRHNQYKALIMAFTTRNDYLLKGFHNLPQPITCSSSIIPISRIKTVNCSIVSGNFDFRIRNCCSDSQKPLDNDQRARAFVSPRHQLVRDLENSSSFSSENGRYINGNGTCQGGKPHGFSAYPVTGNIVVAVDVDEVLGNFVSALNRFIADRYSSNHSVSEYYVYEFFKIWNCSRNEADMRVHEFFKTSYFKSGIYPLPGAQKVVHKLSRFCKLSVVTSRQNVIKDHTIDWIEKHYPGIFHEIHFGNHFALDGESKSKSEICRSLGATVLIDDNPRYAVECAEVGIKVLLFDYENSYPWCKIDSVDQHPLVTKVRNWEQVEQQLVSWFS